MNNEVTLFTPTQCRLKADAKLALADRGGVERETLLADADLWMLLADWLERIEAAAKSARRKLH